ncbi:hypothetical protein LXM60_15230 [Pandoraea sputorum]|uniref:hypothetical protein n=1 Tax=Pandoraea sputorum TaxID=93222 RepID=UPI001E3757C4|nr:hypothetical protein [Pandoraea sputorum]MCE4061557.1 hypothetical protein [Pandoraea sputorum]
MIWRGGESAVFLLYCAMFGMLSFSILNESDGRFGEYLTLYFVSLVVAYIGFRFLFSKYRASSASQRQQWLQGSNRAADILLAVSCAIIVAHFIYLGHIPLFTASMSNDYFGVMRVRQAIFFDAPAVFRYLPNFVLKSFLPFLTLYFYVQGARWRFVFTMLLGLLYGVALLTKIFVVIPLLPLILYLVLRGRFVKAIGCTALIAAFLAILVFVQNPQVRPTFWTSPDQVTMSGTPLYTESAPVPAKARTASYPAFQFVETIYIRVFAIPGQVITAWFNDIPAKVPFAHGCGYRWLAAIRGCEFQFFPQLVHDIENPILVAQGVHGTMTAASFMEDYANFGGKGMVFGAVMMAFVLALVASVFGREWRWALVMNCIPIGLLIELPLTTVLLTGGWALTILLFLVFRHSLNAVAPQNK